MTAAARSRGGSGALARTVVWVPLVLLLLAASWWVISWQRDVAAAAAERAELLVAVDTAVAASPLDMEALSRLMAKLQKQPDHGTARDLLAAAARIELARDRSDRAIALFASLAVQPGATAAEQRLGAAILLRHQETSANDPSTSMGTLRQVLELLETAAESGTADDLLRGWQAASRVGDQPAKARFAGLLRDRHPDSPATKLLQIAEAFDPKMQIGALDSLRAEFTSPPPELDAMRALVVLQGGDVTGAVAAIDTLLARSPGAFAVRMAAMVVFHTCAFGHAAESAARQQWLERRNTQIDWLLARAGPDDPNRERWTAMRSSR